MEREFLDRAALGSIALLASLVLGGTARALLAGPQGSGAPGSSPSGAEDHDPDGALLRRERSQATPWDRGPVRVFRQSPERESARADSLAQRAERRAYEGAPPVIPHSGVFGQGTKTCVDCHSQGMRIGDRVAHPMSHPPFANCVQCHVEAANREFPPSPPAASSFVGLASPGPGARHSQAAPPIIPHDVAMRGQCLSCHGEFGYPGIQTTHPLRASCMQCHVARAGAR